MIRLLTDENIDQKILRGLHRRLPLLDFVLARDVGLAGLPDLELLKWAAKEQRTILTQDIKTLVPDAKQLVAQGKPMAGVIAIRRSVAIGHVINDLELLLECYSESEMRNCIEYLPFTAEQEQEALRIGPGVGRGSFAPCGERVRELVAWFQE